MKVNDFFLNDIEFIANHWKTPHHSSLVEIIFGILQNRLHGVSKVGLLCSGGDDSMLLLSMLMRLNVDMSVLMILTKSNKSDVLFAENVLKSNNIEFSIVDVADTPNRFEIDFIKKYGRKSHDPVQSIHNYWSHYLHQQKRCKLVLDGQFADTLLLSNPHNQLILLYNQWWSGILPSILSFLIRGNKKGRRIFDRMQKLSFYLSSESKAVLISRLCNVENNKEATLNIEKSLGKYNEQLVFTYFFYNNVIRQREFEKYFLVSDFMFCPFDDLKILSYGLENFTTEVNLLTRKKSIVNYVNKEFHRSRKISKSLPFESS